MPLLTRKKVLTIDRNLIDTVPTTLGNVAQAKNIVLDATVALDVERIERNFSTPTITAIKDLAGQKAVGFTFGIEMKGANTTTDEPEWGRILEGCGFRSEAVAAVVISSGSGTFRHGELVTFSPSSATGTVVKDTHEGDTSLVIFETTGTITASDTILGEDSAATADCDSAEINEGFAWWPISSVEKQVMVLTDSGGGETVGALMEGTLSGARGILSRAFTAADTVMFYFPVRGSFADDDVLDNLTAGTTSDITLTSTPAEQFAKTPSMGIRLYTDGKSVTGNACRGNVVFNMEVNRPVRMDFTFRGTLQDTTDRVLLTGIDFDTLDPPLWESSSIGFAQNETAAEAQVVDEIEPCLSVLSIDMGNQLTDRKCAGAADGLLEVYLSAREGTGSMTVEDTLETDIGWLTRIQDNEVVRLSATVGATAGNRFTISMPGIQFTGHGEGDAEGIVTQDMAFRLTGGNLFDLSTNVRLNAIGGDNEIVIIHHVV